MYSAYVIRSEIDGRFYVGMSSDLESRLKQHNSDCVKSTKAYKPWFVVYSEFIGERSLARKREKYLKSGCGKEFVKNMYFDKLSKGS